MDTGRDDIPTVEGPTLAELAIVAHRLGEAARLAGRLGEAARCFAAAVFLRDLSGESIAVRPGLLSAHDLQRVMRAARAAWGEQDKNEPQSVRQRLQP